MTHLFQNLVVAVVAFGLAFWSDGAFAHAETPQSAPVLQLLRDGAALRAWLVERNRQVGAASARVDQAYADLGGSRLLAPNPTIDVGLSDLVIGQSNPPTPRLTFSDTAVFAVGLSQTIELGKRGPRIDAATLRHDASRQDYVANLASLVADVRFALGKLVYIQARQTELEESLHSAQRVSDLERQRFEHQDLSGNDYNRLVLDTMTLEADVTRNQGELSVAESDCRAVLVAPCDITAADAALLDAAAPVPVDSGPQASIATRADLESLRLQGEASVADAVLARRRAIPDPTIRLGYTHDNLTISGDQPDTLGVTFSLPLALFDHGQYDAARAEAKSRELQFQREATMTSAQATLAGLWRKRAYLEGTLAKLSTEALPKSAQVVDSTSKAFDQGQLSMSDLLLARRTHIGLVLSLMDLRFDLFTVRNELRRVLGLDGDLPKAAQ